MDNACVHTSSKVVEYFACKGLAVLTLPPYSPQFNPIERVFHNIKKVLKRTSTHGRRFEYILAEAIQML
jgi:transposase